MKEDNKCILISLNDDVSELEDLAESLNYDVDKIFIQYREAPNSGLFIGKGKIKEIEEYVNENNIDTAIINAALKPSQQYNLENMLNITVYDRIRLILNIFADRAHSEEARLQVELAKLQYEIPLLRDWIHKARYSEKPGFMAGGEYEVAQYYEIIRKRIKKIKNKLKKIEKERDIRRRKRRKLGFYLVGIVGYTNAGKSTLFNMISGESVSVEDRLFTTLSTTTRKIPDLKKPIILTDTVGLIDKLPHWIIGAFHSTLEEMYLSDLILLIVDVSEDIQEINRKLKTAFDVLLPDIEPSKIIVVLNKIDRRSDEDIQYIIENINLDYNVKDIISISAIDSGYKDKVITGIQRLFEYPNTMIFHLPNDPDSQPFISWLHENCEILSINYENEIIIELRSKEKDLSYITKILKSLNGRVLQKKYQNNSSI
jgi:GTP-binding protein HflX